MNKNNDNDNNDNDKNKKNKKNKFHGGSNNRIIPMYAEPKNSPFISNEQKNINTDRYYENPHNKTVQNPQNGPNANIYDKHKPMDTFMGTTVKKPLVDLQVYEPDRPQNKRPIIEPALYAPIGIPNPYSMPPQMFGYPYQYVPNNIPVLKNYNINITGPSVDHHRVSTIFEDILPKAQFNNTPNTLSERLNILNFIRSVFIKQNDGEDIDINGKTNNSLLSYLKFMELNPYNTNHFSNNPYEGLPNDMLIYRSCYPIRYDKTTGLVQCAKNSVGINIRIYRLTNGEYNIRHIKNVEYYDYDAWRELLYYEYIREKILKTYVCPNFVSMYAYYICEKSDIDFDKILKIKGKNRKLPNTILSNTILPNTISPNCPKNLQGGDLPNIYKNIYKRISPPKYRDIELGPQQFNISNLLNVKSRNKNRQLIPPFLENIKNANVNNTNMNKLNDAANTITGINDINDMYIGKAIVALTEAPTYNLFSWASRTYKINGNVNTMVNTGFHKSNIWHSIILQLMTSLYVLQIHNIAFENFNVESNVYMKDVSAHGNINKYWKYNIDGLEYYIPNYGYVLLIDSNYGDLDNDSGIMGSVDRKYKIYSNNLFTNKNGIMKTTEDINGKCFETFKKSINPNTFTNYFTSIGGTRPSEDVIQLLSTIHTEASTNINKDIGYYISTFMTSFLNNRIGTYLKEKEIINVKQGVSTKFIKGQMVTHLVEFDTYKFVLYLGEESNGKSLILCKNDPDDIHIYKKEVPTGNLFYYSDRNIVQNYKSGEIIFNDESLLETYIINKDK